MRCTDQTRNLAPGTIAIVEPIGLAQPLECRVIKPAGLGLCIGSQVAIGIGALVPIQTEPAQIGHLLLDHPGHDPRLIEIFHTQEQSSAGLTCGQPGHKRCRQTTEMKGSGR